MIAYSCTAQIYCLTSFGIVKFSNILGVISAFSGKSLLNSTLFNVRQAFNTTSSKLLRKIPKHCFFRTKTTFRSILRISTEQTLHSRYIRKVVNLVIQCCISAGSCSPSWASSLINPISIFSYTPHLQAPRLPVIKIVVMDIPIPGNIKYVCFSSTTRIKRINNR